MDKIMLVDLKHPSPTPRLIGKHEFSDLCEEFVLLEVPHFTGGCCDYTESMQKEESRVRKELFKYLIDNGYLN